MATEVSLVDRGLFEVPHDVAISAGGSARTLNLTENSIRPPGNMQYFTNVETLILDKNELEGLTGFPRMDSVRTLWFNNNRVTDLAEFMDQVTSLFPNLTYLTFMRNPASPPLVCMSEEDVSSARRYRLYVIYRLPKLQFLDSAVVSVAERTEAAAQGAFLVVRKPKRSTGAASTGSGAEGSPRDAASLFFGGSAGPTSGAAATGAATPPTGAPGKDDAKKASAFLGLGTTYYDGRHSEGNRFISDKHL